MSGLAWLNDLMTWLAKFVPRLVLVTARQRAVVFRPRGSVTEHMPGLLVYWPLIHALQIVSTQLRTMELAAQLHESEVVQIVISWRIAEPRVALLSLNDVVATLDDWAAGELTDAYDAVRRSDDLARTLQDSLAARCRPHGLEIVTVQVSQRGWALPIRNFTDWAVHEGRELAGNLR